MFRYVGPDKNIHKQTHTFKHTHTHTHTYTHLHLPPVLLHDGVIGDIIGEQGCASEVVSQLHQRLRKPHTPARLSLFLFFILLLLLFLFLFFFIFTTTTTSSTHLPVLTAPLGVLPVYHHLCPPQHYCAVGGWIDGWMGG